MDEDREPMISNARAASGVAGAAQAPAAGWTAQAEGCLPALGWLAAGSVLSCFSPTFYYQAARRRVGGAVLFFVVFGLAIAILQTLGLLRGMAQAGREIPKVFESGRFPEITITNGVAEVNAPQPFIVVDEDRTLVVLDTTGTVTSIDRRRYDRGVLLAQTELVVLQEGGRLQAIPLQNLQDVFGTDPLVVNADTARAFWATFAGVFSVFAFLFLVIWNTLVRLAYLAIIALVFWGVAALVRPGTAFGPVLITGLYALVPVLYARFLLSQIQIGFPGLFTILLVPVWAVALATALLPRAPVPASDSVADYFRAEHPLRVWRMLIGLPLLADFALEVVFNWRAWYVTWSLAFLTLVTLLAVSLWPLVTKNTTPATIG